jgi:hypothetical protein
LWQPTSRELRREPAPAYAGTGFCVAFLWKCGRLRFDAVDECSRPMSPAMLVGPAFAKNRGETREQNQVASKKSTGIGIKFTDLRAVEIIDLRIIYQKGAPIAYVRPLTIQGRCWLWNHVKYPCVGSNAIVDAEQLLELIQQVNADELTIHWQS